MPSLRAAPMTPLPALGVVGVLVGVLVGGGAGCAGGGALEAVLEAPPLEISASDAMKELRFRAIAHTTAAVDGEVRVIVRGPDASTQRSSGGQVRVTMYRGPDAVDDPAPTDDVVPVAATGAVEVPREALSGCVGDCEERYVVVFAAEGLAAETVELPVIVQAQLVYEHAMAAPPGDSLELILE